jgi:hypothetical protein
MFIYSIHNTNHTYSYNNFHLHYLQVRIRRSLDRPGQSELRIITGLWGVDTCEYLAIYNGMRQRKVLDVALIMQGCMFMIVSNLARNLVLFVYITMEST